MSRYYPYGNGENPAPPHTATPATFPSGIAGTEDPLSRIRSSFDNFLSGGDGGSLDLMGLVGSPSKRGRLEATKEQSDLKTQLIVSRCKETQLKKEINTLNTTQQKEIIDLSQKMAALQSGACAHYFINAPWLPLPAYIPLTSMPFSYISLLFFLTRN